LESTQARFWLIDGERNVSYVSPAMKLWLAVDDDLPQTLADALVPDHLLLRDGDTDRGHYTCRLYLPLVSSNEKTAQNQPQTVTAHYLRLQADNSERENVDSPARTTMLIGCLGDFLPDADVPWQIWFGEQGVRETSKLAEELARFRASQSRRVSFLLAGSSTSSRQLRAQVDLACRIRCHVSLTGPHGCGASELAAIIHHASAPDEPLICLDASLMDAELLEVYASPVIAELRENDQARGTLCLDRLDEMPADAQSRLSEWLEVWPQRLRLLGIRPEERLANSAPLHEHLLDTMAMFTITIPTLSSRADDLELIAAGLSRSARLSREAIEIVQAYPWPGQWDEFTAAIRFASEMVTGDRMAREHLPMAIRSYRPSTASDHHVTRLDHELIIGPPTPSPRDFKIDSLDEAVCEYEASLITQAMQAADGNKAEAARRLGISRSRLLRKLAGEK
jgi:DNA-binding NtrC family response regulator